MRARAVFLGAAIGVLGSILGPLVLGAGGAWGQQGGHPMPMPGTGTMPHGQMMQAPGGEGTEREERKEHREHGTPEGWKFQLPKGGDPARGRAAFVKFECFACHEVKGEKFPKPDPGKVGPELSFMAGLHPAEYFAEAIINPSAVIDKGLGYEGPDRSSKMPSFNEDLTVQELLDLVAYLMSLKPPAAAGAAPAGPSAGGHGH